MAIVALVMVTGAPRRAEAQREGVATSTVSKSIPEATVQVIDPESGTSSGGGTTDVNVAEGDILLFRTTIAAIPEKALHAVQAYLTEYIPSNTQVVGVRVIDENELTIPMNLPGLTPNHCGNNCATYTTLCTGQPSGIPTTGVRGTLAQVYGDTGIFFTQDQLLARTPTAVFIETTNGLEVNPAPRRFGAIAENLGLTGSYPFAHNSWDWIQALAFGSNPSAAGNDGDSSLPYGYGSPVGGNAAANSVRYGYHARPENLSTLCNLKADCAAACGAGLDCVCMENTVGGTRTCHRIRFDCSDGPWQRAMYPGAVTTTFTEAGTGKTGDGVRSILPVDSAGFDITPNTPLDWAEDHLGSGITRAVRYALGELRVGKPVTIEIALKVKGTPLDELQNQDISCAEATGSAKASDSTFGTEASWAWFAPIPGCLRLNLQFDVTADRLVGSNSAGFNTINYTVKGRNLSLNAQTSSVVELYWPGGNITFVSATGTYVQTTCFGAPCLRWSLGTLDPSDTFEFIASFTIGGMGSNSQTTFGRFTSTQLPTGYTTQAVTVLKFAPVEELELDYLRNGAGGAYVGYDNNWTAVMEGTLGNSRGSREANISYMEIYNAAITSGWSASGYVCTDAACTTTQAMSCAYNRPGVIRCGNMYNLPAPLERFIRLNVTMPTGQAAGLYTFSAAFFGTPINWAPQETFFRDLFRVPVQRPRAGPPTLDCPIDRLATAITGQAEPNSVVRLYLNGVERAVTTADANGDWSVPQGAWMVSFGPLYIGVEVRATAELDGVLWVSLKSAACFVSGRPVCSDGVDNDGDGLTDFPADPGCDSPTDGDETDDATPQCSDGIDNDGDGWADFPADPSCPGPEGNDESATNVCSDGIDNDGDGLTDLADPGCQNGGWNEIPLTQCYNGRDDDGDGLIDFPEDPGCQSAMDDDETDFPFPDSPIKPRLLVVFDTSGSMNWYSYSSTFTGSDGTLECSEGSGDESRIKKVKAGIRQGVANFGNVDWGLMRYHQRPMSFQCPGTNASLQSGGWQGGGEAPCAGFNFGDLLVGFSPDNVNDIVTWMDDESNFDTVDPADIPRGFDWELRGSGTTPIAGTLYTALDYFEEFSLTDAPITVPCRDYSVILVTDGAESCGGDPVEAAAALLAAGYKTYVIGFATPDQDIINSLNAIAAAGGTSYAVFADNEVDLSTAIAGIVSESIRVELCDGLDNDCDGLADEDWPELGVACDNGLLGECQRVGTYVCGDLYSSVCSVAGELPAPVTEICGNGLDDNCDGQIDEGCCYGPEVCNDRDDYCGRSADYYGPYEDGYEDPRVWDTSTHTRLSCGTDEGVCVAGTMWCLGGAVSCVGDTGPEGPETCDGRDENCDGVVDEGLLQRCYEYGWGCVEDAMQPSGYACLGICMPGYQSCVVGGGGTWGSCDGQVGPGTEVCNGVDDNCDGSIDEGLNQSVTCGLGVCERTVESCPAGVPVQCAPGSPDPNGEYHAGCLDLAHNYCCDTLDQNCNGVVNDGVAPKACQSQTSVGGNYCAGLEYCDEGGSWVNCDAPEPVSEDCNNLDDDCDGRIDNVVNTTDPLSQVCYSGLPSQLGLPDAPCKEGLRTCSAGEWSACTGQVLPSPELCDTLDNDCDGTINEGLTRQCLVSNQHGACQGTESCNTSGLWVNCDAQTPAPEACNGLDDNCNGRTDEGVSRICYPTGQPGCEEQPPGSGTWVCQGVCGTGLEACVEGGAGVWSGSCSGAKLATEPVNELSCDGLDNDCDGRVDEDISQACYSHASGCTFDGTTWTCQGVCQTGTQSCVEGGGGAWTSCLNDAGPSQEVCDATDNDCNGAIDDGIPPQACSRTADVNGVSRTCTGTETCQLGAWVGCTAPIPVEEICDNKDNDCNGLVDDGIAPQTCERSAVIGGQTFTCTGQEICSLGTWIGCNAPTPSAEVCDGVDNDCDGFVDNAIPGQALPLLSESCYNGDPATLGVGICHAGTRTCSGGTFGLCENQQLPEVEACDGLDNDCDGFSDNAVVGQALPLLSQACQTTNQWGVCLGQQVCTGNPADPWTTCDALVASEEVCDGVDNNCDGVIDGVSEACYSFMAEGGCTGDPVNGFQCEGVCHAGLRTCPVLAAPNPGGNTFGACQFEAGPSEEVCDGLDNDCDGFIDEDETNSASPMSRVCYQPGYGANTGCDSPGSCTGICQEGVQTCGDPIAGQWGGCVGEVTPGLEVCDGVDNDCDGSTDEVDDMPWLGQPCTQDATGDPVCNGIWVCIDGVEICSGGAVEPGRCDGLDNDCDGAIDELDELQQDPVFETACGTDVGECRQGTYECIGGGWVCVGEMLPSEEVCDGLDNDCDNIIDNGADCAPVGGRDTYCVEADCRLVCDPTSEMPCQPGYECVEKPTEYGDRYVCMPIVGNCGGETCPTGWICVDDECVDPCAGVNCESWEECRMGFCVDVSCTAVGRPCPSGEFCIDHQCVEDPCLGASCFDEGAYCVRDCDGSECTSRCEPLCVCDGDEYCNQGGDCVEDPCHEASCSPTQRCNRQTGLCEADPCFGLTCFNQTVCFEGSCIDDPCDMVACPWPYECTVQPGVDDQGNAVPVPGCERDPSLWVDGEDGNEFLATGGGGCQCDAPGGGGGGGAMALALIVFGWMLRRRRQAARRQDGGVR